MVYCVGTAWTATLQVILINPTYYRRVCGGAYQPARYLAHPKDITSARSSNSYLITRLIDHPLTAHRSFLHPDPEQPFLQRGSSTEDHRNHVETILITRSSTHVIVPCVVTVPDLNVTLHGVSAPLRPLIHLFHQLKVSSAESLFVCVSSQYPTPLDTSRMTWDNKRGWSIPRRIIDSVQILIWVSCVATLEGKEYKSASYMFHTTGKTKNSISMFTSKVMQSSVSCSVPAQILKSSTLGATKT